MAEIYDLLYRLGVTANYIGFFHTAYAVSLCLEQPDKLLLVTKWLYPEVAKQYGTKWEAVERNIRTVGSIIWRENRPLLEQLARRSLPQKPRNAQLLAILVGVLSLFLPVGRIYSRYGHALLEHLLPRLFGDINAFIQEHLRQKEEPDIRKSQCPVSFHAISAAAISLAFSSASSSITSGLSKRNWHISISCPCTII